LAVPVRGRGENQREGAGSLLLAAAAAQTGLMDALMPALPTEVSHTTTASRRVLLSTLVFLGVVRLRRLWELRSYTGDALGLLTGRRRAYGYRHAERFLADVADQGGAERLTDALAGWTVRLWRPLPDPGGERLAVGVALVRELRRHVPSAPALETADPRRWDADLHGAAGAWWQAGWVATPTPGPPTEPKLIPVITTAATGDPVELARTYFQRWPAQENVIKLWLLPLSAFK